MAWYYFGNVDIHVYTVVSDFALNGLNVYKYTPFYNYSPVWFNVLELLRIVSNNFYVPFHYTIRGFLTIVDFFTLLLLLSIGRLEGLSKTGLIRLSLLFYLNPVSYLITGYFGQFENMALFFIILGLYIYLKYKDGSPTAKYLSWLSYTAGLIVKHDTLILVLTGIINLFKKAKYIVICFLITSILFFLTFIFYWSQGSEGIISNVFFYNSGIGEYGITSFIFLPELKYLFIAGLLIYPFFIKDREIVEQFLLGSLFFITFTTGLYVTYFILPIVFGALRPSKWFLFYSYIVSLTILGSYSFLHLYGFSLIPLNSVWIFTFFWFIFQHFDVCKRKMDLREICKKIGLFIQKNMVALVSLELVIMALIAGMYYEKPIIDRNAARDAYDKAMASINFDYISINPPINANASIYREWLDDYEDNHVAALISYSEISVTGDRYSTYLNKTSVEYQQIQDNLEYCNKKLDTSRSFLNKYENQFKLMSESQISNGTASTVASTNNSPNLMPDVQNNTLIHQNYNKNDLKAIDDAQMALKIVQSDYTSDMQYVRIDVDAFHRDILTWANDRMKIADEAILRAARNKAETGISTVQGEMS